MSTSSQGSKPSSGWQPPSLEEMQAMLPQYRFEKLLGRGGMGAVYKAVQASLDRAVAIKVLPGDLIQDDDDAQFAERFKNEARTMAKMSHPSIVNVFDFGETQTGLLYIVMEFIDGTDVAQMILSQGRLPEEYALSITAHVCDALAYAHARGVIHRDIKPANILINVEGAVKVADFGLAKQSDPTQSGLTKTNMAMGTPDFVAPEALIPGVPLDGRADLYAIGVMLYNMLTGEIPRGMWQMPALKVGTDPRFDAIIARAMQNDREARFQTASEIRQELDTILALPRSVIIAQQQAAAEGAAAATRAQKQAEAARLAAPIAAPNPPRGQPPAKSRQSTALLLGGLAAVGLLAAASIYLLRSPESPAGHSTAPGSTQGTSPSVAPAAASGTTLNPTAPVSMPAGVVSFQGHRYQFFPEKLSWDEARAKAEAAKGHLATITSPEENEWIFETFVRNLPPDLSIWLGGTNNNPSRLWTWTTGEPFTFTAWGEKEPGGLPDEVALCFSSMNKGWGDIRTSGIGSMDRRGGYLVEWDDRTPMSTLPNTRPPGWIDLLATMDVTRHAVSGSWLKTDAGLEIHDGPKPPVWPFEFPVTCPPEYDFEIDFTVLKGQHDISQVLPIPGHWFTVRMDAKGSTIGQFLDGLAQQAPGRTEARNADFELRTAQRYRSRVEVRKSSVRVLVNDQEVVAFTGDLKRLTPDPKFAMRDPTHPGVAVHMSEAVIHQAWLHPLPDNPAPSASLTMPAAVPTVAQPDAKTSSHEDLQIARLDAGFRLRYETDAQKPFLEALDKLNQSYLTNGIPKARAAAQARGSLAEVTALDAEKARVEKKEAVPAEDAPDIPEALKNLRQTYRGALAKITADRDAKATPLYDIYLKSLDEHIATLTKAGQIPQAQAAQAWRDDMSRQKPASSSGTAATKTIVPSPTASKAPPPPSGDGSTWRRAAEYLVNHGGYAVAFREGSRIDIRRPEDIPATKHDLIELTIDHLNSGRPDPTEEELQVFNGLRDLRRVWIRIPESRLKVSAYNWLAGNQRLEMVNFEAAGKITDEILTYLSDARELQELHIQYAPQFTGMGLEKMPFIDTLKSADFLSTGIDEKAIQALSLMKNLTILRISASATTDKAMRALTGHKSLLNFDANFTTLGDETASVLATMPQLVSINLGRTKLTDKGLAKLSVLKNLTSLIVTESAVTAKAAQAFEKDLPSCRVTR